jgi:hypothetical protein
MQQRRFSRGAAGRLERKGLLWNRQRAYIVRASKAVSIYEAAVV